MHINPYNLKSTEHIHIKEYPTDAVTREGDRLQHHFSTALFLLPPEKIKGHKDAKGLAWHKVKRRERKRPGRLLRPPYLRSFMVINTSWGHY